MSGHLRRQVVNHASFARSDEHLESARIGWGQQFRIFKRDQLLEEIRATEERLKQSLTRKDFELLKVLKQSAADIGDVESSLGSQRSTGGEHQVDTSVHSDPGV